MDSGRSTALLLLIILLPIGCAREAPRRPPAPADRVFLNGAVHTLDPDRPRASAVAVRAGEIVFVGMDDGARAHLGPETRVMDLGGRMLLPGFHDAHAHLISGAFLELHCNLTGAVEIDDLRARLMRCAQAAGWGEDRWILGGGWDLLAFPDGRPDSAMLDAIVPDRPVYLHSAFGHSAWVNSRALRLAGIDAGTPDPPAGRIERDPATGEPIGVLRDAAMRIVERAIPEHPLEERVRWLRAGIALAHRLGITSLVEPGLDETLIEPYAELSRRGELDLRVLASLSPRAWHPGALDEDVHDLLAARERFRGPNLNVDSVKVYMDGVIETGSGVLLKPYAGRGSFTGEPFHTQEEIDALVRRFDGQGLQVHVHAVGDRAVRMALDAFEGARDSNGRGDNRHHIVHLQLVHPDDAPRFAELGVIANVQALWAYPDPWARDLALPLLGEDRYRRMYPLASILGAGGILVGGSDWFVSSLNPLDAIEVAVRRQDPESTGGEVLNASERVELDAILKAYTLNGAHLMRQEDRVGSIEVGKRADLIVLDRDLFAVPPHEINRSRVVLTLFDGEEVYAAD